jgi:hypothetical protein
MPDEQMALKKCPKHKHTRSYHSLIQHNIANVTGIVQGPASMPCESKCGIRTTLFVYTKLPADASASLPRCPDSAGPLLHDCSCTGTTVVFDHLQKLLLLLLLLLLPGCTLAHTAWPPESGRVPCCSSCNSCCSLRLLLPLLMAQHPC